MQISVAQTKPFKGDLPANMEAHHQLIAAALLYKADAIFFPELSLTGYEPALAKDVAIHPDDAMLNSFQKMSTDHHITIGVGMPTIAPAAIRISMIVFQPNQERQTYSKQLLHPDEWPYFASGEGQLIVSVGNENIAPAICYESLQPSHASHASKLGAAMYVASVAKSQQGLDKAMAHYPAVAQQFSMPVLMSNCVGDCDNFKAVGQSAVWTKQGTIAAQLDDEHEGLLIFNTETSEVIQQIF